MAEAIEYAVCGMSEVRDELQEAFVARDKGMTGALSGANFKVFVQSSTSRTHIILTRTSA